MKSFESVIGHKKIISHFEEAIKMGKVSHAYLLSGEDGSGKMTLAKAFAKALLCEKQEGCGECISCKQIDSDNHPDLIYITHEKYEIRVDEIRKGINETIDIIKTNKLMINVLFDKCCIFFDFFFLQKLDTSPPNEKKIINNNTLFHSKTLIARISGYSKEQNGIITNHIKLNKPTGVNNNL